MTTNGKATDPREALKRGTVSLMKAARLTGVSRRTIYNWLANGKITGVRTAGGSIRIFTDTLFVDMGDLPKKGYATKNFIGPN